MRTAVCSKASSWRTKRREVGVLSRSTTATGRSVGRPLRMSVVKKKRLPTGATIMQKK